LILGAFLFGGSDLRDNSPVNCVGAFAFRKTQLARFDSNNK
jgi:hypothetical protein